MILCLLAALGFLLAIVGGPQRSPLRFDELHHEYAGQLVAALGGVLDVRALVLVGGLVAAEDTIQHVYQRMNGNLAIAGPLTLAYRATLGRLALVAAVNAWLDRAMRRLCR